MITQKMTPYENKRKQMVPSGKAGKGIKGKSKVVTGISNSPNSQRMNKDLIVFMVR